MLKRLEDTEIMAVYKVLSENIKIEGKYDLVPPSPYCASAYSVRAIVLGADPSNKEGITFSHVFDLNPFKAGDNRYFRGIEDNLNLIGLSINDIYVQNVCQNYFLKETGQQEKVWMKAAKVWVPYLKKELDGNFDTNIPIIATAEIIMKALLKDGVEPDSAENIYSCKCVVPYPESSNELGRPLIPLYRHFKYSLKDEKWHAYRNLATSYLKK